MGDLALQVRQRNPVMVHDPDGTDTSRGKIKDGWAAQPTRADDQHARPRQPRLPGSTNLAQDQVARVPLDFRI
jgi:hypothetical protein